MSGNLDLSLNVWSTGRSIGHQGFKAAFISVVAWLELLRNISFHSSGYYGQ
jgi:hypothetical protein